MAESVEVAKCTWLGCEEPAMPGRKLCERHCSNNPARWKPKQKPTIAAAKELLSSSSKTKRLKGMEMLNELHEERLILECALKESEAKVLSVASHAIDFHPPELVGHLLTQPSSLYAYWYMLYGIGRGNFLESEEVIRGVFEERRTLTFEVLEGIGLAYLRSLSSLLTRYLKASLELAIDAKRTRGNKAVAGLDSQDANAWSRDGWAAIRSAVALTRLDAEFQVAQVQRLQTEAIVIHQSLKFRTDLYVFERTERAVRSTFARLEWILFDRGLSSFECASRYADSGITEVLPDFGCTLLKQGRTDELKMLLQKHDAVHFREPGFCYWPLNDWLEHEGFLAHCYAADEGQVFFDYWRARERGVSPPPWWKWL
jgi:hypothetical protein